MSKKVIFILLFLIIVVGSLAFLYYRQTIFSKEILKLEILGPESTKTGDEIEYTIKYKNNGNFTLETPKLTFETPSHAMGEDGKSRLTKDLNDIYPGDENFVKFKARLFGKDGDLLSARAWLSYTPKNLSAKYESSTTFTTKIETTPLNLDFDLPTKLENGKQFEYSINYFSNIDFPLENLSVKLESTNGFNFESSVPSSLDSSEWKLPTLKKSEGGKIKVKGTITSDPGTRLNFKATLGMWQNGEFVILKEATKEVEIIEPLLFISQIVNGSQNYTALPGEVLKYQIYFRNIGSTPFENLFMVVKLDGSAFDFSTLQATDGQARPNDNLIVFDSNQVSALRRLNPQQQASVEFTVKLKNNWTPTESEINNMVIKDNVNISQITQDFEVKVNSALNFAQSVYFQNSPIVNSGDNPPVVGKATTYTIKWKIKNPFNDLKNIKVKAILPDGVSLTGQTSPYDESSKISFDSQSREVLWFAGDAAVNSERYVYFQVSITPEYAGSALPIMGQATASGEDQFTGAVVQTKAAGLNIGSLSDGSGENE